MFNASMTFDLGEDVNALRDMVHRWAQERVKPMAQEIDQKNEFPAELWQEMGELGLLGITVPEEFGGAGMSYLAHTIAVEEIARASASVSLSYGAHSNLCVNQIKLNGTHEQKQKYLPRLISGAPPARAGFGITLVTGAAFTLAGRGQRELRAGDGFLITVLFFFRFGVLNFLPPGLQPDAILLAIIGITLFAAAYLAENIRGGLQSIPKGQYEAAKAMGMTTAQMTMLITLPQALRAVIPAIVGQIITLFKDTSLVSIIGLADFLRVANNIVPGQPDSLGTKLENLVFAAVVYWVFTFTFSRASLRLERRLGVGVR